MDRAMREQREDELRAFSRELDAAEEHVYEGVQLFYRVQDAAYEHASRHGVFLGEVKHVLERNQDEFFEVKGDADRLVERGREAEDEMRRELD